MEGSDRVQDTNGKVTEEDRSRLVVEVEESVDSSFEHCKEYDGSLATGVDGTRNRGAMQRLGEWSKKQMDDSGETLEGEEMQTWKHLFKVQHVKWLADQQDLRMQLSNFKVGAFLGKGSFGKVWLASHFGKKVALKQIDRNFKHAILERDLLVYLRHKRICPILGAFFEGKSFLVLEACYGTVGSLLKRIGPKQLRRFTIQLLQAVEFIHSKDVLHCDIRTENCLIDTNGNLRLSDFGSAIIIEQGATQMKATRSMGQPCNQDSEANLQHLYSKGSDMFAVACTLFKMSKRKTLMGYAIDLEVYRAEQLYGQVFVEGRKESVKTYEDALEIGRKSEKLADRASTSCIGAIIVKLVGPRNERPSARELLVSSAIQGMRDNFLSREYPEDGVMDTSVTAEFDTTEGIEFKPPDSTTYRPSLEKSMAVLYYDHESANRDISEDAIMMGAAGLAQQVTNSGKMTDLFEELLSMNFSSVVEILNQAAVTALPEGSCHPQTLVPVATTSTNQSDDGDIVEVVQNNDQETSDSTAALSKIDKGADTEDKVGGGEIKLTEASMRTESLRVDMSEPEESTSVITTSTPSTSGELLGQIKSLFSDLEKRMTTRLEASVNAQIDAKLRENETTKGDEKKKNKQDEKMTKVSSEKEAGSSTSAGKGGSIPKAGKKNLIDLSSIPIAPPPPVFTPPLTRPPAPGGRKRNQQEGRLSPAREVTPTVPAAFTASKKPVGKPLARTEVRQPTRPSPQTPGTSKSFKTKKAAESVNPGKGEPPKANKSRKRAAEKALDDKKQKMSKKETKLSERKPGQEKKPSRWMCPYCKTKKGSYSYILEHQERCRAKQPSPVPSEGSDDDDNDSE